MLPPCRGPICTEMNPSFRPTRGSWGMGDAGDVDKPVTLSYTPVLGLAFYAYPDEGGGSGGGGGGSTKTSKKSKALFDQIEKDLKAIGRDLAGVSLLDMNGHKQHKKLKPLYNAWTNSDKVIYVNVDKVPILAKALRDQLNVKKDSTRMAELVYATILIRHELHHVEDFKKNGRPTSYKTMCLYEATTYAADADWLKSNRTALNGIGMTDVVIDAFEAVQRAMSKEFKGLAGLQSEAEIKKAMINRKDPDTHKLDPFLPPHDKLEELYEDK